MDPKWARKVSVDAEAGAAAAGNPEIPMPAVYLLQFFQSMQQMGANDINRSSTKSPIPLAEVSETTD